MNMPANSKPVSMDRVVASAKAVYPETAVQYVFQERSDDRSLTVRLGITPTSDEGIKLVVVDSQTAKILDQPQQNEGFMYVMFKLHVDMFAGLPGMLFLGLMGLLFVIALVSGVVLYAPFMRRLNFGLIRKSSGVYKNTLDTHNLLGIATLAWTLVVGSTGVINAWSDLVIKFWQSDQMAAMTAGYQYMPPPLTYTSLQSAVQTAQSHEPSMRLSFIAFPGTDFSSLHHYTIYMKGDSPLTKRLFKPILIDAQTGRYTDSREIPWYLIILLISQPLHFGDYGGLPLKILWALFDLIAIVVLWSGLKLWWLKRNVYKKYSERDHAEAIKNI